MKKLYTLTCKHETRFGIDVYQSIHPSYQAAEAYADVVKAECDYEPEYGEYFDFYVDEHELGWLQKGLS